MNLRKTSRDTQLDLLGTKLDVRNAEVLRPAEASFGQEDKGSHHTEAVRRTEGHQRAEKDHHGHGPKQCPPPAADRSAEAGQKDRTKDKAQILGQGEHAGTTVVSRVREEEDVDHGWVDDIGAIVEHGDDEADDEGGRQLAAVVAREDARGRERLLERCKGLPHAKEDEATEAGAQRADDNRARRGHGGGIDDANEDESRGQDEEDGADIIELP